MVEVVRFTIACTIGFGFGAWGPHHLLRKQWQLAGAMIGGGFAALGMDALLRLAFG